MKCGTRYLLSNGEEQRDDEDSDRQKWMFMRLLLVRKKTVMVVRMVEMVRMLTAMTVRMIMTKTVMVIIPQIRTKRFSNSRKRTQHLVITE